MTNVNTKIKEYKKKNYLGDNKQKDNDSKVINWLRSDKNLLQGIIQSGGLEGGGKMRRRKRKGGGKREGKENIQIRREIGDKVLIRVRLCFRVQIMLFCVLLLF